MNDDQRLLAHAALDGELTAEERTRAEADPIVAAEIERLTAVRTGLRAVDPLPPARRAAVLAAALDAFDAGAGGGAEDVPTVVAPPPSSLAARRRARWLLPAAAAALVGVAVVGAIVGTGGDDDGDDGLEVADAVLEAAAEESSGTDVGQVLDETAATGMVDDQLTASVVLVRTPDELAAYAAAVEAPSTTTTSELSAEAQATTGVTATLAAPTPDTSGGGQSDAAGGTVAAEATGVGPSCPVEGQYLGTVSYGSDSTRAVLVDVVRRGDVIVALAVEGCVAIAVAPGP